MAKKPVTPEEKLFAVIQGTPAKGTGRGSGKGTFSLPQLWRRLQAALLQPRVDLPRANRVLLVIIGALVLAGGLNPLLLRPDLDQVMAEALQTVEPVNFPAPLSHLKSLEVYEGLMARQNPFRLREVVPHVPATPSIASSGLSYEQMLQEDFRLVGIAHSGEGPIAMIEQVSQGRTYFLKVGEPIAVFTVKAIFEDRVLLEVDSQELELF